MFQIKHIQNDETRANYLELSNQKNNTYAKIYLDQGASLQDLVINKKIIIKNLNTSKYEDTYESSLLFPFANRIKNGVYQFQNKTHKLDINKIEENNAIHGLIYNKTFTIEEQQVSEKSAIVKLKYSEKNKTEGFPFKYDVELTYILTVNDLILTVLILNTDFESLPFSLGWHPYFYSNNLYNSSLSFDSDKKVSFDFNMIPNGIKDIDFGNKLLIKDNKFDDCFILNNNKISFKTPDYKIDISSSTKNNYLQIYTPPNSNSVAIEPCTAPPDCFNNKIGIKVLNTKEKYQLTWKIDLIH